MKNTSGLNGFDDPVLWVGVVSFVGFWGALLTGAFLFNVYLGLLGVCVLSWVGIAAALSVIRERKRQQKDDGRGK